VLISAAVCPHPPLIVPEVARGAAHELDALRDACRDALDALSGDPLIVVGSGPRTQDFGPDAPGTLRPYGVDVTVGTGPPVLPLSLTIGRWLLGDRSARYRSVAQDATPEECERLGAALAHDRRVSLLVMGDGTACRTEKAPGHLDPRADAFDAEAARAFAAADAAALSRLDADLATDLLVAGRAPWQVLAGAARGADFAARLHYDEAPYGVGYLVASWTRA
jgi:aromatic ring-opening dioxygenase LigB subunit